MSKFRERGNPLYKEDVTCVKDFFYKNVKKEKNKKTEIINI